MSEKEPSVALEPRYDLDDQTMKHIIASAIESRGHNHEGEISYFEVGSDHPLANVGRTIECRVFKERFGNTPNEMLREYSPYDSSSRFFIAVDGQSSQPVGVMRAIENGPNGLKILHDFSREHSAYEALPQYGGKPIVIDEEMLAQAHGISSLDDCWELGTIAIMPGYRNSQQSFYKQGVISAQLIRSLYLSARSRGIKHMIAAMDTRPYEKMVKGFLGLPYEPLANTPPFEYLGSDSTQLIYGHVPEFYGEMSKKMWTIRGLMAHAALKRLVLGSDDRSIQLADPAPRIYRG